MLSGSGFVGAFIGWCAAIAVAVVTVDYWYGLQLTILGATIGTIVGILNLRKFLKSHDNMEEQHQSKSKDI